MEIDDKNALLAEMHEQIMKLASSPFVEGPRLDVGPDTIRGKCLSILHKSKPLTSSEVADQIDVEADVTKPLYELYISHLIERSQDMPYRYSLNRSGVSVVNSWSDDYTQSELKSALRGSVKDSEKPWKGTELTRSQYYALKSVVEMNGYNSASELDEKYMEYGFGSDVEKPSISARLTELKSAGCVESTPAEPYLYWATEKGKDIING